MNILFTCSARKWGGNEAWVLNAVQVLQQRHQVYLAYRSEEIGNRVTVDKFRLPFMNEADLQTLMQLVGIIKKHRIDVVVPTKRKDYFLAGIACKLTGAKNVMILGIVRDLKNTAVNNMVYNILADGVMVNAQTIKDVLLQSPFMNPGKIAVIPNSVSIDRESVIPSPKKFGFTITSLAELSERKGFDFLIKGFAAFVKKYGIRDAGLVIMGTGGELDKLVALTRTLDIERLVIFTGFLRDPYPNLLSGDVFALTSKNEGIPYAIIEAALLDNAIITTKAGGTEELLKNNEHCLYVGYGDEALLAEQLFRLYSDRALREKLSENARKTTMERFSLEKMEREMIDFLKTIRNR
jgi:glycosyltransferase involved in cell wall biosynthesis